MKATVRAADHTDRVVAADVRPRKVFLETGHHRVNLTFVEEHIEGNSGRVTGHFNRRCHGQDRVIGRTDDSHLSLPEAEAEVARVAHQQVIGAQCIGWHGDPTVGRIDRVGDRVDSDGSGGQYVDSLGQHFTSFAAVTGDLSVRWHNHRRHFTGRDIDGSNEAEVWDVDHCFLVSLAKDSHRQFLVAGTGHVGEPEIGAELILGPGVDEVGNLLQAEAIVGLQVRIGRLSRRNDDGVRTGHGERIENLIGRVGANQRTVRIEQVEAGQRTEQVRIVTLHIQSPLIPHVANERVNVILARLVEAGNIGPQFTGRRPHIVRVEDDELVRTILAATKSEEAIVQQQGIGTGFGKRQLILIRQPITESDDAAWTGKLPIEKELPTRQEVGENILSRDASNVYVRLCPGVSISASIRWSSEICSVVSSATAHSWNV